MILVAAAGNPNIVEELKQGKTLGDRTSRRRCKSDRATRVEPRYCDRPRVGAPAVCGAVGGNAGVLIACQKTWS